MAERLESFESPGWDGGRWARPAIFALGLFGLLLALWAVPEPTFQEWRLSSPRAQELEQPAFEREEGALACSEGPVAPRVIDCRPDERDSARGG